MNKVRAWKDPEYRSTLTAQELSELEPNPAGLVELGTDEMDSVAGGTTWACATITLTITVCSPTGTLCGSCSMGTRGCC